MEALASLTQVTSSCPTHVDTSVFCGDARSPRGGGHATHVPTGAIISVAAVTSRTGAASPKQRPSVPLLARPSPGPETWRLPPFAAAQHFVPSLCILTCGTSWDGKGAPWTQAAQSLTAADGSCGGVREGLRPAACAVCAATSAGCAATLTSAEVQPRFGPPSQPFGGAGAPSRERAIAICMSR
jgi:hypothetical protein